MIARHIGLALVLIAAGCGGSERVSPSPEDAGADAATPRCDPSGAATVKVNDDGLYGYPPYVADGCVLVYVAQDGSLWKRALDDGTEAALAPASEHPRRPAIGGGTIAWEAVDPNGRSVVRVAQSGAPISIAGPFDHAGEPRVADGAVVFTGWLRPGDLVDTDVFLYEIASGAVTVIGTGPAQQRFADIAGDVVAFTDFTEDPDSVFNENNEDLADIVVYTRSTKTLTKRSSPGKQAFPMVVSSTRVGYLHWDWAEIHPEPKLSAFWLRAGDIAAPAANDVAITHVTDQAPPYVRPSGKNGVLEWVTHQTELWRAPADQSSAPQRIDGLDGLTLYAPATSTTFTVVATRTALGSPATLKGIAR